MTAYLEQDFLCPSCLRPMGHFSPQHNRQFVYCMNQNCSEYRKIGSYPLQEVHLQPEETNG